MKRTLLISSLIAPAVWGQAWVNSIPSGQLEPALTVSNVGTIFDPVALGRDLDGDNVFYMPSLTIGLSADLIIKASKMRTIGPVVFVVTGNVTIGSGGSTISVSGEPFVTGTNGPINGPQPVPGPGGYGAGQGPGAGGVSTTGHTFATTWPQTSACSAAHALGNCGSAYGFPTLLPLVGGSGGTNSATHWGGAGGGAIRIVAGGTISINGGAINAAGGTSGTGGVGAGSGGAIHLIAAGYSGTLSLNVGAGFSAGRIRIDGPLGTATVSTGPGGPAPLLVPETPATPFALPKFGSFRVSVNGTLIPNAATASYQLADAVFNGAAAPTILINSKNIPVGTTMKMVCQSLSGNRQEFDLGALTGTLDAGTVTTTLTSVLQGAVTRCAVSAQW